MKIAIRFTVRNSDNGGYVVWDNEQKATVLGSLFYDLTAAQDEAMRLNRQFRAIR